MTEGAHLLRLLVPIRGVGAVAALHTAAAAAVELVVHMTLMGTGSGVVGLWCWPVRLLGAPVVCGGCQVVRR
jgi:hypothetical protein